MSLVNTKWLEENFDKVKVIDCSWHMPQTNRSGFEEYKKQHIKNSIFFDLDKNSKKDTDLPHMLTDLNSWENIVSNMGIKNNERIVIYDNSDVISSCRCWYNFIYFGHNPSLVHVLDGGLKKWIIEKKTTTDDLTKIIKSNYKANENKKLVKNKQEIDKNIEKKEYNVIDARSIDRFEGRVSEPRKGLKSGSIKNSFCLPFTDLINNDRTFITKDKILKKFQHIKCDLNKNLIFSCGSGVTASVLALAYSLIDNKYMPTIYDGSWSEYGKF
ncbi:rhodanese-like domain-containing protein [Candidatus Pelagibacter bacterium]|nr:rhodanese-like domain-containing protein [Candidatus Pelagibacter bacterium]|tara:strand:+ start:507 stop:1319 length:813 start_codon:yes stop_codon:yes gene_type:complete